MLNKMCKLVVILILSWKAITVSVAVNLESAEKVYCPNPLPEPANNFNKEAFQSPCNVWYHLYWSTYYLYRVAHDVTRKPYENITENDINNSFLRFSAVLPNKVAEFGFNGCLRTYVLGAGNDGSILWKMEDSSDWEATSVIVKAGNDYFVAVTCFPTNQLGFTVAALTKRLSYRTEQEILKYARSLGFKDIIQPKWDTCGKNLTNNKNYYY